MGSTFSSIVCRYIRPLEKFLILIFTFCLLSFQFLYSQNKWLNFTASNEIKDVAFVNGFVWAATTGGLMRIDPRTHQTFLFNPSNSDIPSNNLSRLYVDRNNIMWIGTYGQGVVRYDGKEWKSFNENMNGLKNDPVLSFAADNSGILWIGTEMGVNRYYDGGIRSDWDIQGIIQDIMLDKTGVLWIATTGGLERIKDCKIISFEGQVSKPVPFFNVRNLSLGKNNDVWMLTDKGVVVYRDGSYSPYYGPVLKPYSLAVDSNGTMWFGMQDGILRFQGGKTDKFEADQNRPRGRVTRIKIDPESRVWACTNVGLFVYDSSWSYINTATSIITSTKSIKIFSDRHKNIWMKNGGNLVFFGKDSTIYFSKGEGAFGAYSFAEDNNGNLWFGQWNGLTMFNGKEWKKIDTISYLMKNRDKEIFRKYKDTAWVKENYNSYLLYEDFDFQPGYYIAPMYADQQGNLWLKADDYLLKYDQKEWTVYDQFNSGIPADDITCLTGDSKGNLWIGTFKNGLYEYDGYNSVGLLSSGTFPDTNIVSLFNFNDTLVVSTNKRIQFFRDFDLTDKNGLMFISPYVRDIFRDTKGNYWFCSRYGLFEFTSPEKRALYDSHNSGLASDYVSSVTEDFAGNLWILTSTGGVNIFNVNTIVNEQRIKDFFTYKGTINPTVEQ